MPAGGERASDEPQLMGSWLEEDHARKRSALPRSKPRVSGEDFPVEPTLRRKEGRAQRPAEKGPSAGLEFGVSSAGRLGAPGVGVGEPLLRKRLARSWPLP